MKTCKQFQIVIKVSLKTLGDAREKIFNRSLIEPILRKKNSTKNISLELTEICRTATFLNARRQESIEQKQLSNYSDLTQLTFTCSK